MATLFLSLLHTSFVSFLPYLTVFCFCQKKKKKNMEIATAIGGAILAPVFQLLLEKLRSHELLHFARRGQVIDELKKWERILVSISALIDDAEDKQMTNALVNIWLRELRDLTYDVEDILEEFAAEVLRRKIEDEDEQHQPPARTTMVQKFIPICCAGLNFSSVKFNSEMMSKIKSVSKKLDEIVAQKELLQLGQHCTDKTKNGPETERFPTTSLVNQAKVYGRDRDSKAIVELLKAERTGSTESVSVISIVGMGGVGKTTLAQLVFNDATLEFDFKVWVSVGEDFDILMITKTLLHSIGECSESNDLNLLQVKLKEKLCKKTFLIVLDDVWTQNYDHWLLLSAPFQVGAPKSRVIITTRNHGVSSVMGSAPARTYLLNELPFDDCLSVLSYHALGGENFNGDPFLKEIGEQIVRKCKGLPLAAKAIGGLLRGKPDSNVWRKVLKSKLWEEETNILPALRLSYYHLPSHLKQCFAYCAIFPNEYAFDKDELVLLWIAEGFLNPPKHNQKTADLGSEYFDDLLSRSFFQKSSTNESTYVMHDLIGDLARLIARDSCFNLGMSLHEKSYAKIRHSSYSRQYYDTYQRFQVFREMKNLRTFLALPIFPHKSTYDYFYLNSQVLHELMPKLKCLRVLSLAGYELLELPSSISCLRLLRYLNLSYTGIQKLPASFCKLYNLQTLILRMCTKLTALPLNIDNLINLEYLDIEGTENLQELPLQLSCLKNLQTLTKFVVRDENGFQLRELKRFPHQKGELHVIGLQNVVNIEDAKLANLKEKKGLNGLKLEWIEDSRGRQNESDALEVLKWLQPHTNLSRLFVTSYGGTVFPWWLGDPTFDNLVQLQIRKCRKITTLPPLGQLSSLRNLYIEGMPEVKEVGAEFYGNVSSSDKAFPSLQTLRIENMSGWEKWSCCDGDDAEKFPKLGELTIRNCFILVGELPKPLPSLSSLFIENCQEILLRSVHNLTSLRRFRLKRVAGLASLDEMHTEALVELQELEMHYCGELTHLWGDGTDAYKLSNLKNLTIYHCEQFVELVKGEKEVLPCNLQVMSIHACGQLEKLPIGLHKLTSLKSLCIVFCPKLISLPETVLPCSLESLKIFNCQSLQSLAIGILGSNLETLMVERCPSLKSFPMGEYCESLKTLNLCYCTSQSLELLYQRLKNLSKLEIVSCAKLEEFPKMGLKIPNLKSLVLTDCENLKSLPNHMDHLTSLVSIDIYRCKALISFAAEGGLPPNLTELNIENCTSLAQPISEWGLSRLTCLVKVGIVGTSPSTDMPSFPDEDGEMLPASLVGIRIIGLENLKYISKGILNMKCLQYIRIVKCPKLQSFPKEGFPSTLEDLDVSQCPSIVDKCLKDTGVFWPIIAHIPKLRIR